MVLLFGSLLRVVVGREDNKCADESYVTTFSAWFVYIEVASCCVECPSTAGKVTQLHDASRSYLGRRGGCQRSAVRVQVLS
jgi:hypothetical protein